MLHSNNQTGFFRETCAFLPSTKPKSHFRTSGKGTGEKRRQPGRNSSRDVLNQNRYQQNSPVPRRIQRGPQSLRSETRLIGGEGGIARHIPVPGPAGSLRSRKIAPGDFLPGTSLCRALRARCAREKSLPAIFSNHWVRTKSTPAPNTKAPSKGAFVFGGGPSLMRTRLPNSLLAGKIQGIFAAPNYCCSATTNCA